MFRRNRICLFSTFLYASDVLFHYPRFSPTSHLSNNLPEIIDTKMLLHSSQKETHRDIMLRNLQRAQEIFDSFFASTPIQKTEPIVKELQMIVASKCQLLSEISHFPSSIQKSWDVDAIIMRDCASALKCIQQCKTTSLSTMDVNSFDANCVLLSEFTKATVRFLHRETKLQLGTAEKLREAFQISSSEGEKNVVEEEKNKSTTISGGLTLPTDVILPLEEIAVMCNELCDVAAVLTKSPQSPIVDLPDQKKSIRAAHARLRGLHALLLLMESGNPALALDLMQEATKLSFLVDPQINISFVKDDEKHAAQERHRKDWDDVKMDLDQNQALMAKMNVEPGLFRVTEAELTELVAGSGDYWGPNALDEATSEKLLSALDFYEVYFGTPLLEREEHMMVPIDMAEGSHNIVMRDAYTSALLSAAGIYMNVAREDPHDHYFGLQQHALSLSPFCTVHGALLAKKKQEEMANKQKERDQPSTYTFSKLVTRKKPVSPDFAKKKSQKYLERALKINRILFPSDHQNYKSGLMLRQLAVLYAELKDYLYASGLFRNTQKTFEVFRGQNIPHEELLDVLELEETFQRRIGSINEAAVSQTLIEKMKADLSKRHIII